jgi:hypothetical protein
VVDSDLVHLGVGFLQKHSQWFQFPRWLLGAHRLLDWSVIFYA